MDLFTEYVPPFHLSLHDSETPPGSGESEACPAARGTCHRAKSAAADEVDATDSAAAPCRCTWTSFGAGSVQLRLGVFQRRAGRAAGGAGGTAGGAQEAQGESAEAVDEEALQGGRENAGGQRKEGHHCRNPSNETWSEWRIMEAVQDGGSRNIRSQSCSIHF